MTSSSSDGNKMYYRTIGNTGMVTSIFGFGFWATFGVKSGLLGDEGIQQAKSILKVARDGGINLFDNAELYGKTTGEAERIFGQAYHELKKEDPELWRRSDVIITTKFFWGGTGYNENGLSRKHLKEGMKASLERLQLDYVDLVFCHRPDNLTPTETVVRAMTELVRNGQAMAWGTSEWSAAQIVEAYWIAKTEGLEPPQMEQPQYHLFHREKFEKEYHILYKSPYNIGMTTWSPLAGGMLTGKYNDGKIPDDSRANQDGYSWVKQKIQGWKKDGTLDKVKELTKYAEENLNCSVADLALAWCAKNPNATCVLLGATKVHQIESNLKALRIIGILTDEHMSAIEKILDNRPEDFFSYPRTFPTI